MAADVSPFERNGFEIHPEVVAREILDAPIVELSRAQGRANRRSLLRDNRSVTELANGTELKRLADAALGDDAFPVRAILFDKTAGANWGVPWHQDLAIPVAERIEARGFSAWSVKDGAPHVLPPHSILAEMITLRLHLDECGRDNGALRVIPGSHRFGKLSDNAIARLRGSTPEVTCLASRGSVLAMRPLLLHASSAAKNFGHRRVLHIEYAAQPLPHGLTWPEHRNWVFA